MIEGMNAGRRGGVVVMESSIVIDMDNIYQNLKLYASQTAQAGAIFVLRAAAASTFGSRTGLLTVPTSESVPNGSLPTDETSSRAGQLSQPKQPDVNSTSDPVSTAFLSARRCPLCGGIDGGHLLRRISSQPVKAGVFSAQAALLCVGPAQNGVGYLIEHAHSGRVSMTRRKFVWTPC
jgi:hypothetical protein